MTTPTGRTPARLAVPARRSFLAGALGTSVLGLAACGGNSDSAAGGGAEAGAGPETTEPVVLTVAWWGGPARAENTQKVLDLYTKAHPNVTFKTQWQGYSGYYDKINTSAAGRNAPDIIQIDNRALREYANKSVIADLTPWVGGTLKTDAIDPKLIDTGEVDGKLYAMPLASNTQALAVDATVLQPLNLLPAESGWADWDEFAAWATSVTTATGGLWGTRDESANLNWLEYWLRQGGKNLYDGQALGFGETELTEWFTMWGDLRDSGGASPAEVSQPANAGDISKNTVATKQTVATFSYDNQLTELAKATDHQLQLVPLPGDPAGAYARPSQYFTAYARGKNIPTAVDVINFFDNDPEAGAVLGTERGLPPNSEVRAAIAPAFSEQLKYVLEFDERVTATAGPTPPVPAQGDSQIGQLLTSAAENVAFGRAEAGAAAAEFVSQANSALKRAGS
ncbi:multiple sugar transport system substrate-binding protein [Kineococcus radiotolerans]|uniref:Extracellular solute-binding protein family 1 n=2 Tax=Kineococcus radiotolerans TaxID=131568 RepID=A6W5I9_KINRD|nr:ABC transporter substrate-binding protein [Kineococcus radiotolerans]ABS02078.1 extracellular solute-binding protein family 1 [Kineococcus radiotolerans SRS30216 = ATCC BAA-149]MBB2900770.1 multiple sugar transport system substrate-binding protein [Kineococcus radiotolerans]